VTRGFAMNEAAGEFPVRTSLRVKQLQGLDGETITRLRPFQIGELILEPDL